LIKDDDQKNGKEESNVDTYDESFFQTPQALKFGTDINNGTSGISTRQDYTFGRNANYAPRTSDLPVQDNSSSPNNPQLNNDLTFMPDAPSDGFYDESNGNSGYRAKSTRPQYDKFCKRTILLSNLPDGATHADVVDVIRGGMLLDIYLRTHDRAASVSFLEEDHAQEFFRHAKRHDIYIGGKRVTPPDPKSNMD
jgi:hypothetical protein